NLSAGFPTAPLGSPGRLRFTTAPALRARGGEQRLRRPAALPELTLVGPDTPPPREAPAAWCSSAGHARCRERRPRLWARPPALRSLHKPARAPRPGLGGSHGQALHREELPQLTDAWLPRARARPGRLRRSSGGGGPV